MELVLGGVLLQLLLLVVMARGVCQAVAMVVMGVCQAVAMVVLKGLWEVVRRLVCSRGGNVKARQEVMLWRRRLTFWRSVFLVTEVCALRNCPSCYWPRAEPQ